MDLMAIWGLGISIGSSVFEGRWEAGDWGFDGVNLMAGGGFGWSGFYGGGLNSQDVSVLR